MMLSAADLDYPVQVGHRPFVSGKAGIGGRGGDCLQILLAVGKRASAPGIVSRWGGPAQVMKAEEVQVADCAIVAVGPKRGTKQGNAGRWFAHFCLGGMDDQHVTMFLANLPDICQKFFQQYNGANDWIVFIRLKHTYSTS